MDNVQGTTTPQVNQLFAFHKLNDQGIAKSQSIADLFHNLVGELHTVVFAGQDAKATSGNIAWEGREWAIVKTKLEEACFFAKKAMATQVVNQAQH